jgi:protein-tyrosine phosphatase
MLKYNKAYITFAIKILGDMTYKGASCTISWVDENLAIGDITDVTLRDALREQGIEFIVDVRVHFHSAGLLDMAPLPSVWKFAQDILDLSEKGKVLVHCHGGIDRSPFVAMLYYKLKHGCDFEEAYNHVQKVRPQCICHDEWVRLVKEW